MKYLSLILLLFSAGLLSDECETIDMPESALIITKMVGANDAFNYQVIGPQVLDNSAITNIYLWVYFDSDYSNPDLIVPLEFEKKEGIIEASFFARRNFNLIEVVAKYGNLKCSPSAIGRHKNT